ncbi:MAG TPA: nuclear transport factor 2 family protein [Candidatus Angelobacter sp.]|nr:nuclear transport factor 2 family protein [Candidatus Angelobacter sp.]
MSRGRIALYALLISVGIPLGVAGQEPVKPPLNPRIITATRQAKIFTDLEAQLLRAVQAKDQATLQNLLGDDCMIEMPDADPLPGDDWVSSVVGKDFSLKSFTIRQLSVLDLGDSAVVKFDRVQQATYKGQPANGESFVVDVWKKSGESWKLANRYVSKVSSVPWMPKGDVKPTGKQ